MHVLLTNDDGPPGVDSPYIHYFVEAVRKYTDWDLSIALPHQQRSWIGKAHIMGQDITASYVYPGEEVGEPFEGPIDAPKADSDEQAWVLLDGTPASCANIGIHHLFKEKGPVDLVLSGPNYGRNCTALYIMSSGTVGASMESALCGVKSIALSFSFKQKGVHEPEHIREASRISVELIKNLYENWSEDAQLYAVNVPLVDTLNGKTPIRYAPILENQWGASFDGGKSTEGKLVFKWNPDFGACARSVAASSPGNDGWVVANDMISVTPLVASFKQCRQTSGQIHLNNACNPTSNGTTEEEKVVCAVSIPKSNYLYPVWEKALSEQFGDRLTLVDEPPKVGKAFHYADYDDLDFDRLGSGDANYLACSYVYRKGLIRKHFLTNTVQVYTAKNPASILKEAYPPSFHLEVDYAEFLDDALDESYELRMQVEESDGKATWILKPSMSDRGQGIRLFKTLDQLQAIFDEFDEGVTTDDEDEEVSRPESDEDNNGVITSQMRHFVVQKYLDNPLILAEHGGRKFHIRTYVLASGALNVYVYRHMLALFALSTYSRPSKDDSDHIPLHGHLTNTCLQGESKDEESVNLFWELKGLSDKDKSHIFKQICEITGEVFKAASVVDRINFQPLDTAFEFYGLDFLVLDDFSVKLLEINAYPDFKQTGDDLKQVIEGLFSAATKTVIAPYFDEQTDASEDLTPVLKSSLNNW
ncbi:probable tubulin--tyrosine ligase Pby1p [Trichomonascus vanleenenianus]|uniref:putative tubulin tyrosine ligase n=1 Tax=Trichomonascus vanleenenianus TaxID=2268995 RepID=UPI003EC99B8D